MGMTDCHKYKGCKLKNMAKMTIPWIEDVLERFQLKERDEKIQEVLRVMRGTVNSPGFIEDWLTNHAVDRKKIRKLAEIIVKKNQVDLEMICGFCQLYIGPKRKKK